MPRPSRPSRNLSAAALLALVALVCLPQAAGGAGNSLPRLVEHVKRAVVIVNAFDERGRVISQGSGFFIRQDLIVTNLHVVGRAARVEVTTYGGETCAVDGAAAFDGRRDLALLRVSQAWARQVTTLDPADRLPGEGEEIFVVSNPRGSPWQVSEGKTSAAWVSPDLGPLLPFTAPIARGSSGGPVVNSRGQVVGVATMILQSPAERFFAVPGGEIAGLQTRSHAPMPFPLQPTR